MPEEKTKSHKDNLPIGEILTKSWQMLVKNINMFLVLALIGVGLMVILWVIGLVAGFSIAGLTGIASLATTKGSTYPFAGLFTGIGAISILIIGLAGLFIYTWMLSAVNYAVYNVAKENKVDAWGNYKLGLKKFWVFLGVSIVVAILVSIGFMLLIIPGIIVSIFLAYSFYLIVMENASVGKAISRSFALAKKNWATILIVMLIIGIASMILNWIPIVNLIVGPAASIFGTLAIAQMYEKVK